MTTHASHTITDTGDAATMSITGEIDMSNSGDLLQWCLQAIAVPQRRSVIADLSGLTFLDSSGIRALIDAHTTASGCGIAFSIASPRPIGRDILAVTGVLDLLTDGSSPLR